MTLRYKEAVNLGNVAHNVEDNNPVNFKILTMGNHNVPSKFLYDKETTESVLNRIIETTLETHPEWPQKHFCNVVNNNGVIYLNYLTIIPDEIKNKQGNWITLFDILSKDRDVDFNYHSIIRHISLSLIGQQNA